jgi:hypothetical protein
MQVEKLFNPLFDVQTFYTNNQIDDISTTTILKHVVQRYNSSNVLDKFKMINTLSSIKLTMEPTPTTGEESTGVKVNEFIGKYKAHLIFSALVLVVLCIVIYFYGGYIHYVLTWPYHLLCKMVGDTAVSSTTTLTVPHWLIPFVETTMPVETLVTAGPSDVVKTVGALLSLAWTSCLGYLGWAGFQKPQSETS